MAYCRSPEWEELWHAVAGWWTTCCNIVNSDGEDFPRDWGKGFSTIIRLLPVLAPHIERWAFIDLSEAIETWNPRVFGERPEPEPMNLINDRMMRLRHVVDEIRVLAVVYEDKDESEAVDIPRLRLRAPKCPKCGKQTKATTSPPGYQHWKCECGATGKRRRSITDGAL